MNLLDQLRKYSVVVADTGDFHLLSRFSPRDATTNPSLILKSVRQPEYAALLKDVMRECGGLTVEDAVDRLLVRFGAEILQLVPGRVSTEVDARLSFDVEATLAKGRRLISLYEAQGISRERVLIKIASTWEGIRAAEALEREGIHCNMTLLFSVCQAKACADARVKLISPFVGRVYDWYKKAAGPTWDEAAHKGSNDPGVQLVSRIHRYYKTTGVQTEVMGASFRNVEQITALAGCDLLTISPELLGLLQSAEGVLRPVLIDDAAGDEAVALELYSEAGFRHALNQDAMATEKLAEGIRGFVTDSDQLDQMIKALR